MKDDVVIIAPSAELSKVAACIWSMLPVQFNGELTEPEINLKSHQLNSYFSVGFKER